MDYLEKYVIVTDSGSDLPYDFLAKEKIACVDLTCVFESSGQAVKSKEIDVNGFYESMVNGEVIKTSAPNPEDFKDIFEPIIREGKDILYIGLDSALSTTYNSSLIAASELSDDYPGRTILCVDSKCACLGLGFLVYEVLKKCKEGYILKDAYDYATEIVPNVSHRFTVDTLTYLCRGGRVSKTAKTAGNILNIKPVLHVDDEGNLVPVAKVRGRKKSIECLADAFGETVMGIHSTDIFIAHANCIEDAKLLEEMLKTRYNVEVTMISNVGPVIGSHAGPGTLALFFMAISR